MKRILGGIWVTLAMMCLVQASYCQGTLTLSPLYVFTDGDGSITPYQNGQMLTVGMNYELTATPDAGYEFNSWQPVNVFIITQTNYDNFGDPIIPPTQSIIPSVVATNIYGADLEFTMQDTESVAAGNPTIVEAFGWQANFVPVPEPAETAIVSCGLAFIAAVRRRQRQRRRF
jgi:Divergent InlB B-repeat domain